MSKYACLLKKILRIILKIRTGIFPCLPLLYRVWHVIGIYNIREFAHTTPDIQTQALLAIYLTKGNFYAKMSVLNNT